MNNKIGPSQAYGTLQDLCSKHDLDDRLITKLICMSAQDKGLQNSWNEQS